MRRPWARIRELLAFLYGREAASPLLERLQSVLQRWAGCLRPPVVVDPQECHRLRFDQGDCLLIAYGDQFRERGAAPLETLERTMTLLFHDLLRGVHVLLFFPYSCDDGFSVMDFRAVDPRLGDWGHIERIAERRLLMVDLVLNHASARGAWLDLISGQVLSPEQDGGGLTAIPVGPYQALWLAERRATEEAGLHPVTQAARPAPAEPAESVTPQDRECPECVRIFRRLSRPLYPVPTGLRSRGRLRLPVQAVLFDLYGTLLVSAAGDPESRDPSGSLAPPGLQELLERYGCPRSPRSLAQELAAAVRREHERLRGQGADFPEVPIEEVWAGLLGLEDPARARAFAAEYEALVNPVWPMPGLRDVLAGLRRLGLQLGIVSNAQFYTPYLFECFLGADARALGFREELCLYSFELGLAKPSPRLFAIARERLAAAGIRPGRVLLVGNDARTDLAPARQAGFQTVLFAGDARSLRGAEEAGAATAVIIALAELPRLLA